MKETKVTKTTKLSALESIIRADRPDVITGSIKDLKKLDLDQHSELLGVTVRPEPEHVELKDFKEREELDLYVKDLLGDNLTINRRNRHRLVGTQEDADRLQLDTTSEIYGLKVIIK